MSRLLGLELSAGTCVGLSSLLTEMPSKGGANALREAAHTASGADSMIVQ